MGMHVAACAAPALNGVNCEAIGTFATQAFVPVPFREGSYPLQIEHVVPSRSRPCGTSVVSFKMHGFYSVELLVIEPGTPDLGYIGSLSLSSDAEIERIIEALAPHLSESWKLVKKVRALRSTSNPLHWLKTLYNDLRSTARPSAAYDLVRRDAAVSGGITSGTEALKLIWGGGNTQGHYTPEDSLKAMLLAARCGLVEVVDITERDSTIKITDFCWDLAAVHVEAWNSRLRSEQNALLAKIQASSALVASLQGQLEEARKELAGLEEERRRSAPPPLIALPEQRG